MKQKVVAVVGPTASGKTSLSLALAKRFAGEIISADSMQVYREMSIGTAKPSMEEREGIRHHLMGHVSVEESYSVAAYVEEAERTLLELQSRNIVPILCGGTGLYIDHLLFHTDFFDIPQDESVRLFYQNISKEYGGNALYTLLKEVDPILADKLHPNDTKRIIRGLEVWKLTGNRLSDYQASSHRESIYDVLWLGLTYDDRNKLYDRIDLRVDQMIQNGLLDEINHLVRAYKLSSTARAAIGYKEIIDAMECNGSLEDAVALVKQKSRNYAKRQLTWFNRNRDIHWFKVDLLDDESLLTQATNLVDVFLKGENV